MLSIEVEKFEFQMGTNMIVVYNNPADFPGAYVARLWEVTPDGSKPTPYMTRASSLEEIRETLPPDVVCFGRDRSDDPCIAETWF